MNHLSNSILGTDLSTKEYKANLCKVKQGYTLKKGLAKS